VTSGHAVVRVATAVALLVAVHTHADLCADAEALPMALGWPLDEKPRTSWTPKRKPSKEIKRTPPGRR
jgi:hypothetical protein